MHVFWREFWDTSKHVNRDERVKSLVSGALDHAKQMRYSKGFARRSDVKVARGSGPRINQKSQGR